MRSGTDLTRDTDSRRPDAASTKAAMHCPTQPRPGRPGPFVLPQHPDSCGARRACVPRSAPKPDGGRPCSGRLPAFAVPPSSCSAASARPNPAARPKEIWVSAAATAESVARPPGRPVAGSVTQLAWHELVSQVGAESQRIGRRARPNDSMQVRDRFVLHRFAGAPGPGPPGSPLREPPSGPPSARHSVRLRSALRRVRPDSPEGLRPDSGQAALLPSPAGSLRLRHAGPGKPGQVRLRK